MLALLFMFVSLVASHGYLSNPLPRAKTIPGHRYMSEPQSDGRMNGECQDGGKTGPIQVAWEQNSIIEVTVTVTAYHKGWHELRFCPQANGTNACFEKYKARPLVPSTVPGCPTSAPAGSTDKPCLSDPSVRADLPSGTSRSEWQLPLGLECEHCAMQWWWITDNWGSEHFKSCHDVIIGDYEIPPTTTLAPIGDENCVGDRVTTGCSATKCCETGCCSQWGYCGFGSEYCENGCQSTCDQ
eukprot:Lithocolla_globosa_v1_NODE_8375_length_828_cov_16.698577.p1 type:complete len:241 gc:universal NODE_8375_length_828_cov_16.698577:784-62(-)